MVVSVADHDDLADAAASLAGHGGQVHVGTSLAADPALKGLRLRPMSGRTSVAVQELDRLLRSGDMRHDGAAHLTAQVLAVRTTPSADGARLVSKARADAVKAAAWAAEAARARASAQVRILLPSGV